jgi:hypothetical protein
VVGFGSTIGMLDRAMQVGENCLHHSLGFYYAAFSANTKDSYGTKALPPPTDMNFFWPGCC